MKKTFIIAEAGVNHNGSLRMAVEMIDAAIDADADAVKFQTFNAKNLASSHTPRAEYQIKAVDNNESHLEMLEKLQLDNSEYAELMKHCKKQGIIFLSSPFDLESIDFLSNTLNISKLKIPSGEISNAPFLYKAAATGKEIILSTGMSTLGEIELALGILASAYINNNEKPSLSSFIKAYTSKKGQNVLKKKVTLLHCTSEYPAPFAEVNLRAMDTLYQAFGLRVGYSDHTPGIAVPIAAVARGATVIEKHFTLNRNLPGPDHNSSLEPSELKEMISCIRQVELSIGSALKAPSPSEYKNKNVSRKSLIAASNIKEGEVFTVDNLTIKRPGTGIPPVYYWDYLGQKAGKDYKEDELI